MHSLSTSACTRTKRGFTLIELLTVIAIIGILAAILIPTVSKVRNSAKKASCVARLRQWGSITSACAADSKGYFLLDFNNGFYDKYCGMNATKVESEKDGVSRLLKASEAMSVCPTGINGGNTVNGKMYTFVIPIGLTARKPGNLFGARDDTDRYIMRVSDAASPVRLISMVECANGTNLNPGNQAGIQAAVANIRTIQLNDGYVRHNGQAMALFLDGHVSALTVADTDYSQSADKLTQMFSLR